MTRHLAIGDIHGCFKALTTLIDFVGIRRDDTMITLGDYINRGPDSSAVLDWLIHYHSIGQLVPLRGNHDIMMLSARDDDVAFRTFIDVGGWATLQSYSSTKIDSRDEFVDCIPDHHWRFLESNLLPVFETDNHFFVHANAYPDIPLNEQPDFMLYWERFDDPPPHESGKIMVCGHTSQKSGIPITNGNAICIDTWAYGDGWLTCLDVESGMIWQANQAGETRQMFVDELSV